MSDHAWRGPVSRLVYGLIFAEGLDDDLVDRFVALIVEGRVLTGGATTYRQAIAGALAAPDPVSTLHDVPHGEAAVRDFLRRLAERLPR